MPVPIAPEAMQRLNELVTDPSGQMSTYPFPPNIAGTIPMEMRQRILRWMLDKYIWPQVQARKQYEQDWDRLLEMARASLKYTSALAPEDTKLKLRREDNLRQLEDSESNSDITLNERLEISDTVIFDAIDRLTNLNHFIAFKEKLPVQYSMPEDVIYPHENEVYSPTSLMIRSANAWLKFNAAGQHVYRKGWITARHHYTYGISLVDAQFHQKIEMVPRRQPDKAFKNMPELTEIGTTFEPLSLRKVWLNPRLSIYDMKYQGCPFFFDEMPRFAVIANKYNTQTSPFGFANTDKLPNAQWLFSAEETSSWQKGMEERDRTISPLPVMDPKYDIELLWTFYPMLPLGINPSAVTEDNPEGYIFDDDGTLGAPMTRWIMQSFGNQLCNGQQEIIRLQRNFYPNDDLPIFGSAHMPTLDDGAYPLAIGNILGNHYTQICKALLQVMDNKDLINDPPHKIMAGSPAMSKNLNQKGAKIPVNSMGDYAPQSIVDATQSAPQFLDRVRASAKTSSKATEAILGQALGSRTSATEAQNVFQTAMSGVTTDINLFTYDIFGGWAQRVWDYTGRWVDPDVLQAITGSYGFALKPEHMAIRIGLTTDVGSSFVESVTMQTNIRNILDASVGDPSINRAYLWKELLKLWRFKDVDRIVNDGGMENQIQFATEQAIQTYLGSFVAIDPDQDHDIAIKLKKSFLQDAKSVWNTNPEYAPRGQFLVKQIEQHFIFKQIEMQQQMMAQQRAMLANGDALQPLQTLPPPNQQQPTA